MDGIMKVPNTLAILMDGAKPILSSFYPLPTSYKVNKYIKSNGIDQELYSITTPLQTY